MTTLTNVLNRFAWAVVITCAAWLIAMILDTDPPFRMLSYAATPARPGSVTHIDAVVQRELDRRCSVIYSRVLFDREGRRTDLGPAMILPRQAIEDLDARQRNHLLVEVKIPEHVPPGRATIVTAAFYRCNIWHAIAPIEVTMSWEVVVLPP